MLEIKNGRLMLSSKYAICGSKKIYEKTRSKRKHQAKLSKIPLLGDVLF